MSKKTFDNKSEEGFIKLRRGERTLWLLANHPNAYLLITLISLRARRTSGSPDGLEIGECFIGDFENAGIKSRQQYRTALKTLEDLLTIKKVETCRTRKKSTNGTTTEGTKVILLNSEFYDINKEAVNHPANHCPTTDQPPTNHEQEQQECKNGKNGKKEQQRSPSVSSSVVVFSFLEDEELALTIEDKISLSKLDEEKVLHAVTWYKDTKPYIHDTLIATLTWATRFQPVYKKSLKDSLDKLFTDGEKYSEATCIKNSQGISFHRGMKQGGVKFDDPYFDKKLAETLADFGIKI